MKKIAYGFCCYDCLHKLYPDIHAIVSYDLSNLSPCQIVKDKKHSGLTADNYVSIFDVDDKEKLFVSAMNSTETFGLFRNFQLTLASPSTEIIGYIRENGEYKCDANTILFAQSTTPDKIHPFPEDFNRFYGEKCFYCGNIVLNDRFNK